MAILMRHNKKWIIFVSVAFLMVVGKVYAACPKGQFNYSKLVDGWLKTYYQVLPENHDFPSMNDAQLAATYWCNANGNLGVGGATGIIREMGWDSTHYAGAWFCLYINDMSEWPPFAYQYNQLFIYRTAHGNETCPQPESKVEYLLNPTTIVLMGSNLDL